MWLKTRIYYQKCSEKRLLSVWFWGTELGESMSWTFAGAEVGRVRILPANETGDLVNLRRLRSGPSAACRREGTERRGNCLEHSRLDRKKVKLPLAPHVDQAAGLQLLDVVRQCCRGDGPRLARLRRILAPGSWTARCAPASSNRLGSASALEDRRALRACQARSFAGARTGTRSGFGSRGHVLCVLDSDYRSKERGCPFPAFQSALQ